MWPFRRRRTPEKLVVPEQPGDDGRQVWLRRPNPAEAVTGQFFEPGPVIGTDPGQIYEDEIDPSWLDEETAEH